MEEYYVSMMNIGDCRYEGTIVKRFDNVSYQPLHTDYSTTDSNKFSNPSHFRPATLQEIEAYKSGIGNIKDIIYSKTIEIW